MGPEANNKDEEYKEPIQHPHHNIFGMRLAAAGTATGTSGPVILAGTVDTSSDRLPPISLNDPDKNLDSQKVGATDDLV